jgi:hypothetical protein
MIECPYDWDCFGCNDKNTCFCPLDEDYIEEDNNDDIELD